MGKMRIAATVVLVLGAAGFTAHAEEDVAAPRLEAPGKARGGEIARQALDQGVDDLGVLEQKRHLVQSKAVEPIPLGRMVRLRFELQPLSEDDKPFSIVCATRNYSVRVSMGGSDEEFLMQISGQLLPQKKEDEILLTFESLVGFGSAENEATIETEGSALVEVGKSRELAVLGDHTLVVFVTAED